MDSLEKQVAYQAHQVSDLLEALDSKDDHAVASRVRSFLFSPTNGENPLYVHTSNILNDIHALREQFLPCRDMLVSHPLRQILKLDVEAAEDMARQLKGSRKRLEEKQAKYVALQQKRHADATKVARVGAELEQLREKHRLLECNYQSKLRAISIKTQHDSALGMLKYLQSLQDHFLRMHECIAKQSSWIQSSVQQLTLDRETAVQDLLSEMGEQSNPGTSKAAASAGAGPQPLTYKEGSAHVYLQTSGSYENRYLVASEGDLLIYRRWQDATPISTMSIGSEVLIRLDAGAAIVRVVGGTATQPTMLKLRADSGESAAEWAALLHVFKGRAETEEVGMARMRRRSVRMPGSPSAKLSMASASNRFCAECGGRGVTHAQLRYAVVVCQRCAQEHDQVIGAGECQCELLSKLQPMQLQLVLALGNDTASSVWEAQFQGGAAKPSVNADQAARRNWIISKYQKRAYILKNIETDATLELRRILKAPPGEDMLVSVARELARGASLSGVAHLVCSNEWQSSGLLLLLLWNNGMSLDAMDKLGRTALQAALLHDDVAAARFLLLRGATSDAEEPPGSRCRALWRQRREERRQDGPARAPRLPFHSSSDDEDFVGLEELAQMDLKSPRLEQNPQIDLSRRSSDSPALPLDAVEAQPAVSTPSPRKYFKKPTKVAEVKSPSKFRAKPKEEKAISPRDSTMEKLRKLVNKKKRDSSIEDMDTSSLVGPTGGAEDKRISAIPGGQNDAEGNQEKHQSKARSETNEQKLVRALRLLKEMLQNKAITEEEYVNRRKLLLQVDEKSPRSIREVGPDSPTKKAVAKFDYAARDTDEISFKKGDICLIVEADVDGTGWHRVVLRQQDALVPGNYWKMME